MFSELDQKITSAFLNHIVMFTLKVVGICGREDLFFALPFSALILAFMVGLEQKKVENLCLNRYNFLQSDTNMVSQKRTFDFLVTATASSQ